MNRIWHGGGAARGAGCVHSMIELHSMLGLDVILDGTSVGGVNAAGYASGKVDQLPALWMSLARFQRLRWPWQWPWGMYDLTPLRDALVQHLDTDRIACPTYVHVVDVASREYRRVAIHDQPGAYVLDAVIATCSQPPPVHAPADMEGRRVTDGGAHHPMPMVQADPGDRIFALSCAPLTWSTEEPAQSELGLMDYLRVLIEGDHDDDLARLRRQSEYASVTLVEPPDGMDPGAPMDFGEDARRYRLNQIGPAAWAGRQQLHPVTRDE